MPFFKKPEMVTVQCKICGNDYKCAKGSIGEKNQICIPCWILKMSHELPANMEDALKRVKDLILHPEKGKIEE